MMVLLNASFYSNSYGVRETDLCWFLREKVRLGLELIYQVMILNGYCCVASG